MSILRLEHVRREVGTFVILDDVTAAIAVDDRIGLVGPNGAGKTTLLRIAAGRDEPDGGAVHRKRGLTIGLLAQESHFDAAFMASPDLRAAVRHGAAHLEAMGVRLAELEAAGRVEEPAYADLQHQFDILGGYTLDLRVDEALSGLGFARDEWAKPPTALSGGEQTRATLARLVIAQPDLLLLDEPTNHLDIGAIEWLEEHLRRRHGALLVASHDRAFLDATVGRVWELRDRKLTAFRGDYSAYHRQREERDVASGQGRRHPGRRDRAREGARPALSVAPQVQQDARARGAPRASPGRPGRDAENVAPAAAAGRGPRRRRTLAIGRDRRPDRGARGRVPARPGRARRRRPPRDRAAVGRGRAVPCGAAGRPDRDRRAERGGEDDAPPDDRRRPAAARRDADVRQRRPARLPRPAARLGDPGGDGPRRAARGDPDHGRRSARRTWPGSCSAARTCSRRSGSLSGGERSRLELALLGILPSNLLLLDEPTNHLDIAAREAIESFLVESPATLLVVSHDRRLLETVCSTLWVVDDGLAVPFDGGWKAWRTAVTEGWTVHEAAERERRRLRVPVAAASAATRPSSVDEVGAGRRRARERLGPKGPFCAPERAPPVRGRSCRRTPTGARRPRSMPS